MEVIEVAGKLLGLAVADLGGGAAGGGAESASEDEDTCWSREGSGASYEGGASDDDDGAGGKRKRMSTADRKARNRERNRLHARKTRQRKKQHVQELQLKIWGLRQERQRLLQLSTEHRTAGVLLALSCSPKQCVQSSRSSFTSTTSSSSSSSRETGAASPHSLKLPGRDWSRELASHEDALRKITQEFESMDGSQQMGDDNCGTAAACDEVDGGGDGGGGVGGRGSTGGKGSRGGKGTLADRTALRRERNRMHAKRTRNRKKLFVEACSVMIDKMKVENAQLEHEIQESGIRLPQESWVDEGQETVPEEPLPEYLAALWDFAEGKTHCPKPASPGTCTAVADAMTSPSATPTPAPAGMRYSRQTSSSSCTSSMFSTSTEAPSSVHSSPATTRPPPAINPGQALEDASTLCAFMEAAQTRSAKRPRVRVAQQQYDGGGVGGGGGGGGGGASGSAQHQQQQQLQREQQHLPRLWSDHGSTTSESRGSSESDEDAANERRRSRSSAGIKQPPTHHAGGESGGGGGVSGADGGAMLSPALWTSRQVLERYVLPRQQLPRG